MPIEFVDINGRVRLARYLRIIEHADFDVVHNKPIIRKYVEAEIIGKFRPNWKEYYTVEEFRARNPKLWKRLKVRRELWG